MHIPRIWAKAGAHVRAKDARDLDLVAWGWGESLPEAQRQAAERLERLAGRVRRGEPFPDTYAYGSRPLREEILETIDGDGEPRAILTRNRYGATVLNTARLAFLDIDVEVGSSAGFLGRLFSRASPEEAAVAKVRETLERAGKSAFRLYRTAAGFRAIATGREFDPGGPEAQELMKATGTDPFFVRLCAAQKSFRARLTPKPWRIGMKAPPWEYPRDAGAQRKFEDWLAEYERTSKGYAACRFVATVGKGGFGGFSDADLVERHDRLTRATQALPLA